LRGHRENCTLWPDYSVGAVGSDLIAFILSPDAGPAVIIGTSMAAGVAESGCGSTGTDSRPDAGRSLCTRQDSLAYSIPRSSPGDVAASLFDSVSYNKPAVLTLY